MFKFDFLKRTPKVQVQDEPIPLMDAETARKMYVSKMEEVNSKEWEDAHAAIPRVAKAIAKASANGDYKIRYDGVTSERVSKKLATLLQKKGYSTYSRYGSSEIDISW